MTGPHPLEPWPPASAAIDFPTFKAMLDADPTLCSGPGSITWRINGEMMLAMGSAAAILMQLAHPMIAAGVAHHSSFAVSTVARIKRFRQTVEVVLRMTFGSPYEMWSAAQSVDRTHAFVYGELETEGHRRYSARYPDLLKWVHSSVIHTWLTMYPQFIGPLSGAEKDDYVHKVSVVGPLLGAPIGCFPDSFREVDDYVQSMLSSGGLLVDQQARTLARQLLEGLPVPLLGQALGLSLKLYTAGLLPPVLRAAYGFPWGYLEETAFNTAAFASREYHRRAPGLLHRWPLVLIG